MAFALTQEMFEQIRDGELSIDDAMALLRSAAVSIQRNGQIRVCDGACITTTAAQFLLREENRAAIHDLLRTYRDVEIREERRERNGDTYSAFLAGDLLVGYTEQQVAAFRSFACDDTVPEADVATDRVAAHGWGFTTLLRRWLPIRCFGA